MRAAVIRQIGALELVDDWATPTAGVGQVVVRVAACGVCHRDLIDRDGGYPWMRRPVVTGHELAGTIEAVGDGVRGFAVGERVAAVHRAPCGECAACAGGDETRCTASLGHVRRHRRRRLCRAGGAGGGVAGARARRVELGRRRCCTAPRRVALRALRRQARLVAGETVVMTGASGGVGVHALQVARMLGARVVAVTSSEAKAQRLRELGAEDDRGRARCAVAQGGHGAHRRRCRRGARAGGRADVQRRAAIAALRRAHGGRRQRDDGARRGEPGLLISRELQCTARPPRPAPSWPKSSTGAVRNAAPDHRRPPPARRSARGQAPSRQTGARTALYQDR